MNGHQRGLILVTLVSFAGALVTIFILYKLIQNQNTLILRLNELLRFS